MQAPKKALSLPVLVALVAGNMIGSGVFMLPAALADYGTIGILAWMLTSIGALFLALMFSEFSRLVPKTGGPYAYTREGFGDFVGFLVAYSYWIGMWVGNAAIAVAFVGYVSVFCPELNSTPTHAFLTSAAVVWVLTFINVWGTKKAGLVQLITTILKLIPLILVATLGLQKVHFQAIVQQFNISGMGFFPALTGAATLTFWSFVGVESATIPAEEVENPSRNIPLATIIGTSIATAVYLLGAISILGSIPLAELRHSTAPFADCAGLIFGFYGKYIIAAGAAIACFGTLNGWLLVQGQVPLAAARDDLFPKIFAVCNRSGVPVWGLLISSVLITVLLILSSSPSLIKQFTVIILLATFSSVMPYFLTAMAQLMVYVKNPAARNSGSIKKSVFIALASAVYSYWLIIGSGETIVYAGFLLLFSGIPVYVYLQWCRQKERPKRATIH